MASQSVAAILGVTADIGRALASRLIADGWRVAGFGRSCDRLGDFDRCAEFEFFQCDLTDKSSIASAVERFHASGQAWRLFVSCAGTMEPIGRFFDLPFDQWEDSFIINSAAQLRVLHGLWPSRERNGSVDIMFFAGGGTNNPFTNYSAYCVSKIALIKMCELIDDEEPETNVFIIGPGFVQTRIHQETLRAGDHAGDGYKKTLAFLETEGTSLDDIYAHMRWCMSSGRAIAGGRNFSTVHDPWRGEINDFKERLRFDSNACKLRRQPWGR
jgi:NAD(P)-dependent dehydrogenase (short-subunit alcohol dehydrogenase family)